MAASPTVGGAGIPSTVGGVGVPSLLIEREEEGDRRSKREEEGEGAAIFVKRIRV